MKTGSYNLNIELKFNQDDIDRWMKTVTQFLEERRALKKRLIQESDQREHQHGDARGQAPEAGGSDRNEQGRQGEEGQGQGAYGAGRDEEVIKAWEEVKGGTEKYKCESCGRLTCGCGRY
jgi:hypothetical protein